MNTVEIAACQVFVTVDDYASEERFLALLERIGRRLDAARARDERGELAHPCLAVFPEMIGAFLPLAGRSTIAGLARTTDGAFALAAIRELPALVRAMAQGRTWSAKVGFLLAAAAEVRRIYRSAFSRFAREHRCWVIAGSALLPRNRHGDTAPEFSPADGRVYNTSYAFSPEGEQVGCVRKVNLVPTLEDTLGLSPGSPRELEAFETPFGKVGTLICYDGFRVAHTDREPGFVPLVRRYEECAIIAQPAANPWPWEERWVFARPGDERLRREQWTTEGIFSQLAEARPARVRCAVTPQLLGQVLDTRFDGRSQILGVEGGAVRVLAEAGRADASLAAEDVLVRAVDLDDGPAPLGL